MKRSANSPAAYVAQLEGDHREMVERIRAVIADVAPDVTETLDRGMLDYPGLANVAAQKHYVALYVAAAPLAAHKDRFPGTSCGKCCLRFKRPQQVDETALADLLRAVRSDRRAAADDG